MRMSIQQTDIYGWQLAEVLANRRALFVLWAVKTMFCTRVADFLYHYKITEDELSPLLDKLTVQGFLQQDGENYVLTSLGDQTVSYLGELEISEFAHSERPSIEINDRFERVKQEEQAQEAVASDHHDASTEGDDALHLEVAARFWRGREQDQGKPEATLVELPFIQQLVELGWEYLPGDTGVPELTYRSSFREVIIEKHLREVLPEINRDRDSNEVWLDEPRVEQAINDLKRIFVTHTSSLMQANQEATTLLLTGTFVRGTEQLHQGRMERVRYINFEHPERNLFFVVNQFRVDLAGSRYIVPDIVLFVNGVPLVVIECKSPALTNPVEEGITQLLRYLAQTTEPQLQEDSEASPELFYFNQLLIVSCFFQARFAPIGASYEHFYEWKDPYPLDEYELAQDLHIDQPSSQQTLIQGMLLPVHLLDLLYNFTVFQPSAGKTVKLVAHYQQFRAVQEAIERLLNNPTRQQDGEEDRRGGIIWHTQGSGKSLTMVFLVRKMRTIPELRDFKIVFVTDRTELERQLRQTAYLTEETPHTVSSINELEPLLLPEGPRLVFAMIQKYQSRRNQSYRVEADEDAYDASGDEADDQDDEADPNMEEINRQENILVIVDEAHRSQARKLHANLRKALPNCARIAFTGTPIIMGKKKKTLEIFGPFIDEYTIKQSELDGATLPIFYEGRETFIEVTRPVQLDEQHETIIHPLPREMRESLQERYETYREVLEAQDVIATKAEDMLLHYAANILPNGFKAMVVAVSRLAAIRYRDALEAAHKRLVARLEKLPPEQRDLPKEQLRHLDADEEIKKLILAYPYRDTLARLQFAAVVSPSARDLTDDRVDWRRWTNEDQNEQTIENFKKPLHHADPDQANPIAFLCVRSMLITGFDAPVVQALYLDRSIKDHELLQAIARVNRVSPNKTNGLVVDYFGIASNLKEALHAYSEYDVQGALISIKDELPLLADRHRRLLAIFKTHQVPIQDVESCVSLLKDLRTRADFEMKFKKFMQSMDIVLPRPEALPYVEDAQQLGLINQAAAATYRDEQLNLIGIGNKVRRLIDEHIEALKIRQLIEPISILDENFERKLRRHTSDENNAAEMEHFARAYIDYKFKQEDPAYYQKLSERLDAIVRALYENWSQRVNALEAFIKEMRRPRRIDFTGLNPRTERPFLGILEEEVRKGSRRFAIPYTPEGNGRSLSDAELLQLADLTRMIVQLIRSEIINNDDFWLTAENQERLRREIGLMLEVQGQKLLDPYTRREAVASRLVSLAHALTARLRNE